VTTPALGVEFDDPELEASVRADLHTIEAALRVAVQSDDEFVNGAASHLVAAGGKRFRPLVSTLAAHFGDSTRIELVPAAVVIELTHLATLYHDDVMDEAPVRRGASSANARWDNTVAILTGDFLFSRASNLLADLGPYAVRLQARTFERLVVGQIRETVGPKDGADPIDHYLAVLADKTGSLIAAAAEFGGHYAGVDEATVAQLREYAEQVGVAFQLSDDILDIASESSD
jgi:heptaprenyl diphosphate synthase